MSGQGLKVECTFGAESTMTFDEAMTAFASFCGQRVLVSIADEEANACAGVRGVMKRCLMGADSETGELVAFDIGITGFVVLSRASFMGASWVDDHGTGVLSLQNGAMLLTVRCHARPVGEVI